MRIADPPAVPVLTPVSKRVFYTSKSVLSTQNSVKKCLIDTTVRALRQDEADEEKLDSGGDDPADRGASKRASPRNSFQRRACLAMELDLKLPITHVFEVTRH